MTLTDDRPNSEPCRAPRASCIPCLLLLAPGRRQRGAGLQAGPDSSSNPRPGPSCWHRGPGQRLCHRSAAPAGASPLPAAAHVTAMLLPPKMQQTETPPAHRGGRVGISTNINPTQRGRGTLATSHRHIALGDRGPGTVTARQPGPPIIPTAAARAHVGPPESTLQLKVFVCFLLQQVCSGKGHVPPGFPSPRPLGRVSQLPAFQVQPEHWALRSGPADRSEMVQGTVPAGLCQKLGTGVSLQGPPRSIPLPALQTHRLHRAPAEGTFSSAASPPRKDGK